MDRLIIFILALSLQTNAQHLQIYQSAAISLGSSELETPFSAGAEFSTEILAQAAISISLMDVPETQQWCLCVAFFESFSNGEGLAVYPNAMGPMPLTSGTNVPKSPIVPNTLYQPILSGVGPLQDIPMDVYLTNFKVRNATGVRQWPLTWQLRDGPCLFL